MPVQEVFNGLVCKLYISPKKLALLHAYKRYASVGFGTSASASCEGPGEYVHLFVSPESSLIAYRK